jgi:hypothetical protein
MAMRSASWSSILTILASLTASSIHAQETQSGCGGSPPNSALCNSLPRAAASRRKIESMPSTRDAATGRPRARAVPVTAPRGNGAIMFDPRSWEDRSLGRLPNMSRKVKVRNLRESGGHAVSRDDRTSVTACLGGRLDGHDRLKPCSLAGWLGACVFGSPGSRGVPSRQRVDGPPIE